jgi:rsbT co-antagonist protein RsbR
MAISDVGQIFTTQRQDILSGWGAQLRASGALASGRIKEAELDTQTRDFLDLLSHSINAAEGARAEPRAALERMIGEISRARALQGFTPTETATFIFSLKQPLFEAVARATKNDSEGAVITLLRLNDVLDQLGLLSMEVFQKSREEIIIRQQREIAELSTPVVKLWDGILALPLIGTLDSQRTQVVMENLLQSIVDHAADYAIIDITGVPTVDTLVAQHLLKTVAAARLMGAECIISGIRPQIAQTMVHLGVELNVVSKANLADALAAALRATGRTVSTIRPAAAAGGAVQAGAGPRA